MKISNNNYNSAIKIEKTPKNKSFGANIIENHTNNKLKNLQATNPADLSIINTNTPVSYTKIAEIPIPGIDNKASLFRLSNGQKVAILPKSGPTYIRTSFNVGSFNEPDNHRGISHYIEHNLFNGSKNLAPGEYDKKLSALGGSTNAYTNFNETQYYLSLQLLNDNSLEEAIKLNAYQTQFPTFPVDQLEKEKEPVKSEIDMYKDIPSDKTYNAMLKNLFNISSSSDGLIIGNKDNINSFTREKVLDYYNTWYTPDNAVTVITGDVDIDETIQLVSKYYNKKPDLSHTNKRIYENLKPTTTPKRIDLTHSTDPNANITFGFPIDENTPKSEIHKLSVLFSLLESSNSNLSKQLDKYGIGLYFSIEEFLNNPNSPKVIASSISLPENQVEEVLKIIYEGINDLINNPPSQKDIDNITNCIVQNMNNTAEYSNSISSQLVSMITKNELNYFQDKKQAISNLTPNEISQLAKKFLDLNRISIAVSHPNSTPVAQIKQNYVDANSKTKNVSFGKSVNIQKSVLEDINNTKRFKLKNNLELAITNAKNNADSSFFLSLESDNNFNTYASESMVLDILLNRGTAFKNNETFSKLLEELNISIGCAKSANGISFSITAPPDKIDEALPLLKEIILSPNFSQEEFDRAKTIIKEELLSLQKSPADKLNEYLYPFDKSFANINEQIKALDKLSLNDVISQYNNILFNSQASAALCAPIDKNPQIQDFIINNLTVNMPQFKPFTPCNEYKVNAYNPINKEIILKDVQEQSQADILQSYQFKRTPNIDDIAKIQLLNLILGAGGMSSRLFVDLRGNEKLAYHVSSSINTKYDSASIDLKIQTSTDNSITPEATPQNVIKALKGFERNVNDLKNNLISDNELTSVKQQLVASILNSTEGNTDKSLNAISNIDSFYGQHHNLELIKAIEKVTKEDIKAAANYVFANKPITSIVASKKTFDELNL